MRSSHQDSNHWTVRWSTEADHSWLRELLDRDWGGESLVVRGVEKPLLSLPTLVAGARDGVAIFEPGEPGELLLLQALRAGLGIGSALLNAVIVELRKAGTTRLLVATTNDNLAALRFYQKRGFKLYALRPRGVDLARLKKPTIPTIGADGIPMRDEIDLTLLLQEK